MVADSLTVDNFPKHHASSYSLLYLQTIYIYIYIYLYRYRKNSRREARWGICWHGFCSSSSLLVSSSLLFIRSLSNPPFFILIYILSLHKNIYDNLYLTFSLFLDALCFNRTCFCLMGLWIFGLELSIWSLTNDFLNFSLVGSIKLDLTCIKR